MTYIIGLLLLITMTNLCVSLYLVTIMRACFGDVEAEVADGSDEKEEDQAIAT